MKKMEANEAKWERLRAALEERDEPGLLDDLAKLRAISEEKEREEREREAWWDRVQVALFGFDPDEDKAQ